MIKHILLLTTALWLSACGYHLRGSFDLPNELNHVHLEGTSSPLHRVFKQSLRSAGVIWADNSKDAHVVIKIIHEKMHKYTLSLNESGRAQEYELHYTLDFIWLDNQGNVLSDPQSIKITRDYFNNQEELLGKHNEEQLIKNDIYRQATNTLFSRLRVALKPQKTIQK